MMAKQVFSRIPRADPQTSPRTLAQRTRARVGLVTEIGLSLAALPLAAARGTPGATMHARAARLLASAAVRGPARARDIALSSLPAPLDSVRYFEFEFAWRCAGVVRDVRHYLDVSSPRLFPLCFVDSRAELQAHLVNPDRRDLEITRSLAAATALSDRCTFHDLTIERLELADASFDLISSLSVLEHIPAPADTRAAACAFRLLRPGGRLIVTVPVARECTDEFLDFDEYQLGPPRPDGWYFSQRIHDLRSLRETFYSVLGEPLAVEVFGERAPGLFIADRAAKNAGRASRWREPLSVARDWARFPSVDALPGWGVAGLVFAKP
jgi:SAM-dependent methyltransferase